MALLSSILGFSLFGLSARIGQLGIQKRNILESAFLPPPSASTNPLPRYPSSLSLFARNIIPDFPPLFVLCIIFGPRALFFF